MTGGNNYSNVFSLTDEIADIIRDRILKGEYKIGEKIKETQIASELKVSRTPIREAFKQLENEGLIDYIPNRGCFAKGFTKQDIEDIYAVRKALEILCVEWAVSRITEEQIQNLQDQCDLMEFYTVRQDEKKVLEINTGFHDIIYNATGSRFMAQVLRSYKEYIDQTRKALYYEPDYLDEILEEHRSILTAIKNRDVEEGKAAMSRHLDGSKRRAEFIYNVK
ncbi:GntR family transcriptional regulator [Anaerovoracaceae bacterium 41-7]|jgi:DNA-binding GntR family transcriptional regulator|uniref:GntR family transcriptional regulator n=1 Tax=Anaerotruncus colihominis TaxID=169435 RepID=A0A845QJ41_9FIRM|nr:MULTISPECIES: GntR family transcriptional regulator [Anaerotruncus]MCI9475338.1 GntR family transcriptional regulator [Emergencia sp.]NBH60773.1 GntR family transcriptional regulator [Anaerotruncus colihominis]NCF01427.1 GntR family transcriptional regulator [Anaerotruncus sp. 80]